MKQLIFLSLILVASKVLSQTGELVTRSMLENIVKVEKGFGVIVGQDDNNYYIATANHVIESNGSKKKNVQVEHFRMASEDLTADVFKNSYPSDKQDLAVLILSKNQTTFRKPDNMGISNRNYDLRGTEVWYVKDDWLIPVNPCVISSSEDDLLNKLRLEKCDIIDGNSGSPIISKNGIEGIITNDRPGLEGEALSISFISKAFNEWKIPFGNIIDEKRIWGANLPGDGRKVVKEGETWVIGQNGQYFFEELLMEDNSKIALDSSVSHIKIASQVTYIGKNVSILGAGFNGNNGNHGRPGGGGSDCSPGGSGTSGFSGKSGGDGKNIILNLGIKRFGTLLIDTSGGTGGTGGSGGSGGSGGKADCSSNCRGASGGTGGNGGNGGDGGNGGNIELKYYFIDDYYQRLSVERDVALIVDGGESGTGGEEGLGGPGGPGKDCKLFKKGGGGPGHNGLKGQKGNPGKTGSITFGVLPLN